MSRLLILSSDTGEGHNSAAGAIAASAGKAGWDASVRKPSEEAAAGYRFLNGLYNYLLMNRPGWVRFLVRTIDTFKPNEADTCYRIVRGYIAELVRTTAPEVLLSVHPMLNHLIQRWIVEQGLAISRYTFVTDPFPPFWKGWSSPFVDRYFVLSDRAGNELVSNGVPGDRIERVRMPLRAGFEPKRSGEVRLLREEMGLGSAVILVNGGARGGGPVTDLVGTIRRAAPDCDVLVVCGFNRTLQNRLDQAGDARVRTFGFVEDIHKLVGVADLVVTKPGALSTYEALAVGSPPVLTAIGGLMPQESGLFEAARTEGFGFAVRTLEELRGVVSRGADEWRQKREAIASFYNPATLPDLIERIEPSHVRA